MSKVIVNTLSTAKMTALIYAGLILLGLAACGPIKQSQEVLSKPSINLATNSDSSGSSSFTIAVIPDSQNYLDFTRQKNQGFSINSAELFIQQMQFIADNARGKGGDIVFATSLGDVWQHQTIEMDAVHRARGAQAINNPLLKKAVEPHEQTKTVEMPKAKQGFALLDQVDLPFAVAPGNHDYDAQWSVAGYPPNLNKPVGELVMEDLDLGLLHVGGLDNFRSVFGSDKPFFADKDWYVSSFRGGANSAQKFVAGGYAFLHLALEMQPDDAVIDWAAKVIRQHAGLPTIVTTHDYLDPQGRREGVPIIDLSIAEPNYHNNAQQLWDKLLSQHEQIFLVLSGHHYGRALRIDNNAFDQPVIQMMADYQERGQVGVDAGQSVNPFSGEPQGIGDGWLRLLEFELAGQDPKLKVSTYSTYYKQYSYQLANYAKWYKPYESLGQSDQEFHDSDHFVLELGDFHRRFAGAKQEAKQK